jgi:hypothetical protein
LIPASSSDLLINAPDGKEVEQLYELALIGDVMGFVLDFRIAAKAPQCKGFYCAESNILRKIYALLENTAILQRLLL